MATSKRIAILGGGISGLSAAFYLLKNCIKRGLPISKIYLLEEQPRFGGWMQTLYLNNDDPNNYIELGPRTIRSGSYAGANAISLVDEIGLRNRVKFVSKNSPNFKTRFVVINGKLQKLPSSLVEMFKYHKPFYPGIYYAIKEWRKPPVRLSASGDISVHDFFQYRFDQNVAQYLINPLCIGITGGNSHLLSMRSIFPDLLRKEQEFGSIVKSMFHREDWLQDLSKNDLVNKSIREKWAVFSFDHGIQSLPDGLHQYLTKNFGSLIEFIPETKVTNLLFNSGNNATIEAIQKEQKVNYKVDHVFSSLPAYRLASILPGKNKLTQTLESITTVHMALVCFQFDRPLEFAKQGFGFLVPSIEKSSILGATFDSCIFPSDSTNTITMMLGGHRFVDLFGHPDATNSSDLLNTALNALRTYLNIHSMPDRYHIVIHKNCIPQYTIGHHNRIKVIEDETSSLNLSLLGASYRGFSVPDCILNSRKRVDEWIQQNVNC